MKNFIVTGISGSGRIELLNELKNELMTRGIKSDVFDVGKIIFDSAKAQGIELSDNTILDVDKNLLIALRKIAFDQILLRMTKQQADFNFIGIHAAFRWKERIIKGVTYHDLREFQIDGFMNIVDDVKKIYSANLRNPKWNKDNVPDLVETNNWMMEEEFITEVLADFFSAPIYLIGRNHKIANLADLFLTEKQKFYLSYPITAIEKENPELLKKIREHILPKLQDKFVIFDPLVIKDMELTRAQKIKIPEKIEEISEKAMNQIKVRTVERDFQFIDQSNFVVVIYLTEKVSPGVLSEVYYASKHNKPVYMAYPFSVSPFLQEVTSIIFEKEDKLIEYLLSDDFKLK